MTSFLFLAHRFRRLRCDWWPTHHGWLGRSPTWFPSDLQSFTSLRSVALPHVHAAPLWVGCNVRNKYIVLLSCLQPVHSKSSLFQLLPHHLQLGRSACSRHSSRNGSQRRSRRDRLHSRRHRRFAVTWPHNNNETIRADDITISVCVFVPGSTMHAVFDRYSLLAGASGGVYALIGAHLAIIIMVRIDLQFLRWILLFNNNVFCVE